MSVRPIAVPQPVRLRYGIPDVPLVLTSLWTVGEPEDKVVGLWVARAPGGPGPVYPISAGVPLATVREVARLCGR